MSTWKDVQKRFATCLGRQVNPPTCAPGEYLRIRRMSAGLSQTDLGKGAGLSSSRISEMEAGNAPITAKTVHQLRDVLDLADGEVLALLGFERRDG